ncbi:type I-B CRISPR-associated protein Cas7/Csh2 [Halorussus salilacus]|uniref:type I-B CRISPR-associated protein Cas7/Csh2 n=1 Tax=Halorussus salilacus TaxID=2953750 RepID=UPI0020A10C29|nr:type I-B CRISPR-associated protein Cas7/Csh2 [Halorussus salilacus]USZ68376.1 type I-B CRISPR-associated protein Cas7/Csh2 [Halorussus salilacus]
MTDYTPVENRSEIVFLYDAVDANPNGNPLSGANRPRIDPHTKQAIVTDVRLKRYLRDQLEADGHGVYITSSRERDENAKQREQMIKDALGVTDADDIPEDPYGEFLANAADVRLFGATMSIDTKDDNIIGKIEADLPDHLTGPVQFSPGKTLHPVEINEEYNSLTSVIATGDDKEQGGFDLDDHRIKYGLVGFHGLVDEHAAENTNLAEDDVRRLDTLCWRAIKNQTITRSKVGQEPRLYLRVEYDEESFHLGGLTHLLDVRGRDDADEAGSDRKDPSEFRTVHDVEVDASDLVARLGSHADKVETVHVVESDVLSVSVGDATGEEFEPESLVDALESALGADSVRSVDVYDEYEATRP